MCWCLAHAEGGGSAGRSGKGFRPGTDIDGRVARDCQQHIAAGVMRGACTSIGPHACVLIICSRKGRWACGDKEVSSPPTVDPLAVGRQRAGVLHSVVSLPPRLAGCGCVAAERMM